MEPVDQPVAVHSDWGIHGQCAHKQVWSVGRDGLVARSSFVGEMRKTIKAIPSAGAPFTIYLACEKVIRWEGQAVVN